MFCGCVQTRGGMNNRPTRFSSKTFTHGFINEADLQSINNSVTKITKKETSWGRKSLPPGIDMQIKGMKDTDTMLAQARLDKNHFLTEFEKLNRRQKGCVKRYLRKYLLKEIVDQLCARYVTENR